MTRSSRTRWWTGSLVTVGLLLVGSALWHLRAVDPSASWLHRSADVVLLGGASLGFLYGGYWHASHDSVVKQYPRIVAWIVSSGVLLASLGVISVYLGSQRVLFGELIEVLQLTGTVGLLMGLLVGTIHARALTEAEAAARAKAEAEALASEQERLSELTDLLRHYTLNSVNVISGYAAQLRSEVPEDKHHVLEKIDDSAETMATLIEHVYSIQRLENESESFVDLAKTVESVLITLEPDAAVTMSASEELPDASVENRVYDALVLLCEVLLTALSDEGTLTISCEQTSQNVAISVRAEPASLPDQIERSLFEPVSTGIGLKLYLAHELIEETGDITLAENAGGELRFVMSVTRVDTSGTASSAET